ETKVLGTGFGAYNAFVTLANFSGNGAPSIVARRTSDGAVVRFDGNGTGGLVSTTPKVITPSGWGGKGYNQWFGSGDITKDGRSDLVVREADGDIIAWKGNGTGGFSGSVKIATWRYFVTMTSPGDLNKDGLSDVVARYSDGRTRLYSVRTATGWGSALALATAPSGDRLLP
ncbi:MAG TPA: VCBS repeat-containing protein, partial [Propionibacteriaceae bacterium]|nr:VCBS repeat-containing protein [Propionibacteriaceae bacterium]